MENASKALIIAGAILVSILIISVGIMIFNSSSGLFDQAKVSMSDQEKQMFNQKFTMYEGTNVSGAIVRELVRSVITNNISDENPNVRFNDITLDETWSHQAVQEIPISGRYIVTCIIDANTGLVSNISVVEK